MVSDTSVIPETDPDTTMPLAEETNPTDDNIGADPAFLSVLNALDEAYQLLSKSKHGLTLSATLNKIYFIYRFPAYKDGTIGCHRIPVQEVMHYNAGALLEHIDRSKYSKFEIYDWLQQMAKTPFSPVAMKHSDFPFMLVHRKQYFRPSKSWTRRSRK